MTDGGGDCGVMESYAKKGILGDKFETLSLICLLFSNRDDCPGGSWIQKLRDSNSVLSLIDASLYVYKSQGETGIWGFSHNCRVQIQEWGL